MPWAGALHERVLKLTQEDVAICYQQAFCNR